jgi:uncharacterized protein YecE (DUF72 family)
LSQSSKTSPELLVGCSGWIYKDWAKRFYPSKLPDSEKLSYYAQHFKSVEINNSFYRLPSEEAFAHWRSQVPGDFIFAVKLSRYLTHIKRLKPDEQTNQGVDLFCSHARHLKANFGVTLIQLPANFQASEEKIEHLAKEFKKAEDKYEMAFPLALEARHESWFTDKIFELLRSHNIANVINSSPKTSWPMSCELTASFSYIRFHGSKRLYASSYSDKELHNWADFIKSDLNLCNRVYCYFNNDNSARAVENAKDLAAIV